MAEQVWWRTPTALTVWTLGTGLIGGIATVILSKRIEKAGWTQIPVAAVVTGVLVASAINLLAAGMIKGKV